MDKEVKLQVPIRVMVDMLLTTVFETEIDGVKIKMDCPEVKQMMESNNHLELLEIKKLVEKIVEILDKNNL